MADKARRLCVCVCLYAHACVVNSDDVEMRARHYVFIFTSFTEAKIVKARERKIPIVKSHRVCVCMSLNKHITNSRQCT